MHGSQATKRRRLERIVRGRQLQLVRDYLIGIDGYLAACLQLLKNVLDLRECELEACECAQGGLERRQVLWPSVAS